MREVTWLMIACLTSACHVVDIRETKRYEFQSHAISKNVWRAIDVGVTDQQWLLQHLGPPSAIENSAGQQIYTYRYAELFEKHQAVFLMYQKQQIDVTQKVHSVTLKNGIVVAHSDITPVPIPVRLAEELTANEVLPVSVTDDVGASAINAAKVSEAEMERAIPAAVVMPAPLDREL